MRAVLFRRTDVVTLRTGEGKAGGLLFGVGSRQRGLFRFILRRREKIGKLESRSCHHGENRHVRLLQEFFYIAQAVAAVVVAAIGDNDYGAPLIYCLALQCTYAYVDAIKKRSAPVCGDEQR